MTKLRIVLVSILMALLALGCAGGKSLSVDPTSSSPVNLGSGGTIPTILPSTLNDITTLTANAVSQTTIHLQWIDSSTSEQGFRILRSVTGGTPVSVATLPAGTITYDDTGLTADTLYSYQVQPFENFTNKTSNIASAKTGPATAATQVPSAPIGLGATVITESEVDLRWTTTSTNETEYRLERQEGTSPFVGIQSLAPLSSGYNDTYVKPLTTYTYRLKACNLVGCSAAIQGTVTTPSGIPTAPSDTTLTVLSGTQINIQWRDNSNNETGFRIERSNALAGPYSEIKTVLSTDFAPGAIPFYNDSSLISGATYYYRIKAYNSSGESAYSLPVGATTVRIVQDSIVYNLEAIAASSSLKTGTGVPADPYRFNFNGQNTEISQASSSALNPPSVSVCAWIRMWNLSSSKTYGNPGPPAGYQYIVFKRNSHTGKFEGYALFKGGTAEGNHFGFSFGNGNDQGGAANPVSATVGNWYHVCGTFQKPSVAVYVNAQGGNLADGSLASYNFDLDYGNRPLFIGRSGENYWDSYLSADVGQVTIYNRALTKQEVIQNCVAGGPNYGGALCFLGP